MALRARALAPAPGANLVGSLCGHGGATSRKAPQTVLDLKPWNLVLRPYVIIRVHSFRFIETTQRNLHTIAERVSCMVRMLLQR